MTGVVILAAGESKRLGEPKQNLTYQDKTLLQLSVAAAMETACRPIIVVLGAYAEIVLPGIANQNIHIIHNADWEEGMASSIRVGISALQKVTGVDSVLVMLCDQPFVDSELLEIMHYEYQVSGKGIVACAYNNTVGVPALFNIKYFEALLNLKGQEGARKLLAAYANDIEQVPFTLGSVDIDTLGDYEGLTNQ